MAATAFLKAQNFASSSLAVPLTSAQLTLTVATGQGALFPSSGTFHAIVANTEIVECTSRTGDVLTITREQEDTTAAASYPVGSSVRMTVTAEYMTQVQEAIEDIETGIKTLDVLSVAGASTLTGAVTAASASNAIKIGTLCDTSAMGPIGGTTAAAVRATTLTATSKTSLAASTTSLATMNVPPGVAPTVPVNGDGWSTTTGVYFRVNGATIGPLIGVAQIPWASPEEIGGTTPNDARFADLVVTGTLWKVGALALRSVPTTGNAYLYIDPICPTQTEVASVSLMRNTNTSGVRQFVIHKGDGTNSETLTFTAATGALRTTGPIRCSTVTTFTANDTTPDVSAGNLFIVPGTWTAGNNITMFDGGVVGQTIQILGGDTDCTVVDGGNLHLVGNWTAAVRATITLTMFDTGVWTETSRTATA
jgi:hypothetical protein